MLQGPRIVKLGTYFIAELLISQVSQACRLLDRSIYEGNPTGEERMRPREDEAELYVERCVCVCWIEVCKCV